MRYRNDLLFYDAVAPDWWNRTAKIYALNHLNPLRFAYFDRYISDWRDRQVLDLGCGGGYTCEFLAQRGAQVWGIDQSQACINAAKAHAASQQLAVDYQQGVAEQLPYADAQFDVVVCVDVLEHVANWQQTLQEIHRVLKPGGYFCFDTINRTLKSKLVMIWLLENILREIPQGIHNWKQFITPKELTAQMKSLNFQETEIKGFSLFGESLADYITTYRYYKRTGQFCGSISEDTSVMYIGKGMKAV
ncbi:MAG: 3-demethylubiquinone-9 3-O-methyltransferase [Synechococcales cyanobacterium C42_A2020_086]|nr:3-demethylubiquinone-9 3-O-methyltransferase [Synechococcales cyanobacterium C42_A2020_086]